MEQSNAVYRPLRLRTANPDIVLDPVAVGDAPALYAIIDRNREWLREWLPWVADDYALEHTQSFLEQNVQQNARGDSLTALIRYRGELAGAIGLHPIDRTNRSSSIGYWIDKAFSGRGIMTEACRAVVTAGFRDFGLHRIEIRCAIGNTRSCAIPIRLGFHEDGVLREVQWVRDKWLSLRVFSALENEWLEDTEPLRTRASGNLLANSRSSE